MMQDVFKIRINSIIALDNVKRIYRRKYKDEAQNIVASGYFTHVKHYCRYIPLQEYNQTFTFDYFAENRRVERKVDMKVFLLCLAEKSYPFGKSFFLVIGTQIDKLFQGNTDTETFCPGDLCTETDLLHLKKAFYNKAYYYDGSNKVDLHCWQNKILKAVTGVNYAGKYGRHYVIDIVATRIETNVYHLSQLNRAFDEAYKKSPLDVTQKYLDGLRQLAYGLLFGNDNCMRTPQRQIDAVLGDGYSNNNAEVTYAGGSTIVFLQTHYPYEKERVSNEKNGVIDTNNLYEVCAIMVAKQKLRHIRNSMSNGNASEIKSSLSDMSEYLSKNPLRLNEQELKMKYFYQKLNINKTFDTILKMGELSSEAITIKQNRNLNRIVVALTACTLIIGIIPLIKDTTNTQPNMLHSLITTACCSDIKLSILTEVTLLLILVCFVICLTLQIMKIRQRKDIKNIIRELEEKGEI